MVPTAVSVLLPIVSLPIILHSLSPSDYGAYALSLAFSSIVVGFSQFALLSVYERNFFLLTSEKERSQLCFTIISFIVFILIIVGLVIYLKKDYLASIIIKSPQYGLLLFYTYIGLALQASSNYYLSFLKNIGNAKMNVGVTLAMSVIGVVLNIYFVGILMIGPIGLALGLFISNAVIFITVTIYFIKKYKYTLNKNLLFHSLELSMRLIPSSILSVIGKQYDKYIIGVLASVGGAGIYALGQRIAKLVVLFMNAIQKVYGPIVYHKMFSKDSKKGGKEIGKYLTPFAYFSVASALFIALFSEEVIIILAPPEYLEALYVINILCVGYGVAFFAKQPQIMYAGKTTLLSVLSFVNFVGTVVVLYIFVNYYGLLGAAVGYLLMSIIYNTLLVWQGQKYYRIEYEWSKLLAIFGMLFFVSISIMLFQVWGLAYYYRLMIKILFLGMFTGLGMHLKIITKSNIELAFKNNKTITV